VTDFW